MTKVNHYILAIDVSDSMKSHVPSLKTQLLKLVNKLSQDALNEEQNARFSIYYFNSGVKRGCFDTDARLVKTDDIKASGMTAIYDALGMALADHQQIGDAINDHAFILYLLTDGGENSSYKYRADVIKPYLAKDNWTFGALVPDYTGKKHCVSMGFDPESVVIWDTTSSKGFDDAVSTISTSSLGYVQQRSAGVKSVKNLFKTNLGDVNEKQVVNSLIEVNYNNFVINKVTQRDINKLTTHKFRDRIEISAFVTDKTGSYVQGNSYYKLTKSEYIQPSKDLIVRHHTSGKMYQGDNARKLLSLPDYEVKVTPGNNGSWDIFVKSTSTNRHLFLDDEVLTKRN